MLFNSYPFLFVYLPIVFCGFFVIGRRSPRAGAVWLAISSIAFYGWWDWRFVALLLASIGFNYGAGYLIGHVRSVRHSKNLLVAAITADLALLAVFKYANFFISSANEAGATLRPLDIILPLGISFFTFTQIAFLVDVYRKIAKEYDFIDYVLFVTWFPHLIAGPVLHHKQMMPQFALLATYRPDAESISIGLTQFSLGLFKKVVLADHLALFANPVFDAVALGARPMLIESWIGVLAYTLQLYFDFSGYSDMAIGISRMFNIKLPINFNSPYKSANIIEFWRRWHMTLSAFLRDYLYFALGGNRSGTARRHVNLMTTMLLGGLWHGAGWNFVLWGGLHGAYLVANHGWRAIRSTPHATHRGLAEAASVLVTFIVVVAAWVPFRAADFTTTLTLWRGMIGANGISLPGPLQPYLGGLLATVTTFNGIDPAFRFAFGETVLWLGAGLAIVWALPNTQQWLARYAPAWDAVSARPTRFPWRPDRRCAVISGLLFAISVLAFRKNSPFLYFQF